MEPKTSSILLNLVAKIESMENQLEQRDQVIRRLENIGNLHLFKKPQHPTEDNTAGTLITVEVGEGNTQLKHYEESNGDKNKIQQRLERSEARRKKAAKKIRHLLKYKKQVDQKVLLKKILQYLD